ncbi:MAG TPA: CPBP family intramembrane glutamic endopeptidase [Chthoniobacterales bacterium]|nr:CPBP family intramembrane glutamic endopeptidase [Chthoniobacterales bacterium]
MEEDPAARRLRGFGVVGIIAILIILLGNQIVVPLSGLLVLLWAWLSRTPWRDLGLVRPRSWARMILVATLFGVALKFAMKSIVMPLLGAPPVNAPFHFLAHNPAEVPWMLYAIVAGAGFGEEIIFRGWAFERLGRLLGSAPWAQALIIAFTSAWFGYAHYGFQGLPGVQNAAIVGLIFGTVFATTRQLFFLMVAHVAFDLAAFAMIYWEFETAVAQFFFK